MLQGWIHTVCTQRRQTMPAYHMSLHHGFCIGFRNIQQMWHRRMMITIPKMPKSSPTSPGWPLLYFGGPPPPARWTLGWTFFKRSLGCCMKVLAWNHQLAPSCSNGLLCPGGESLPNSNGPCPDTWSECVQAAESFFFFPCLNPKTWPTRFVSDTFVGLENYQLDGRLWRGGGSLFLFRWFRIASWRTFQEAKRTSNPQNHRAVPFQWQRPTLQWFQNCNNLW